jgi:heat-inducible transcriptional repressor
VISLITERQISLLKIIVEEYIKTARPVGSKAICEKLKCSSATVRNEMSALEELGYLEKTHTSSGRIPSDNGYRYYVDHIMVPKELNGDEMLKLQTIFKNNSLMLNDVVLRSMEIISELTNYTAIVLGSSSKENLLSRMEVVPLSDNKFLAIVITDKGHVEHRNMEMAENISLDEIRKTVELINKLIVGTPIDEICTKLEFEIKPIIGTYIKQHDAIYNAFYNALNDFKEEASVKVSGASNILMQPEFSNADKIREIVSKFEDKSLVSSIKEEESGVNIYIGSENTLDDDVAIIKTKYSVNGEEGTIALIGPKRMEYGRATALLNYIKKNIER